MSQDFLYKAILGSIVSEKSTRIGEKHNQYVFRVDVYKRQISLCVISNASCISKPISLLIPA